MVVLRPPPLRERRSNPANAPLESAASYLYQFMLMCAILMTSSLSFRYEVGYRYNDLASVERALTEAEGDIAAIFVGGASYPYCGQIEMPTKEFAAGLRTLADAAGAMLVLDEIRTNFRVGKSVRGGHWSELAGPNATDGEMELLAPDMYCQCKALANGHPIAALLGGEAARDGAAQITASGTYWLSAPPMAAALQTLELLEADNSLAMQQMQVGINNHCTALPECIELGRTLMRVPRLIVTGGCRGTTISILAKSGSQ